MQLLDGKRLAKTIQAELKARIEDKRLSPRLAILLVGQDPASQLYVELKKKFAASIDVDIDFVHLEETALQDTLIEQIKTWNQDPAIHGILVQLPLPANLDKDVVMSTISPTKDVDGFHPDNRQALLDGTATIFSPLHQAILRLLGESGIRMIDARTVILGKSDVFKNPLIHLLKKVGALVETFSPDNIDLPTFKAADIVISAVGQAGIIQADMIKDGAVLIDAGTTASEDGGSTGDVNPAGFEQKTGWVSPVPGGVGPLTVAYLFKNVVDLAARSDQAEPS